MFEIGASLREARTRRGLSAADVHKAVRIRERYLTALEEERWEMLPGDAYTKGFLRTYAEFLGLNGQLYIDEYNSRIALHDEEPLVPESMAHSRRRNGVLGTLVAILIVGACVAALAAWRLGGSSKHNGQSSGIGVGAAAAAVTPAKHTSPARAKHAAAPQHAFAVISAPRGRCWLSVRVGGPNGTEIFRGFVEQGPTKRFDLHTPLWVRFGNPAAIELHVAGRVVAGLPNSPTNLLLSRSGSQPA
jgi:transcriptional regulator with XRE-family HTH domain